jgi:hypothetical protein
MTAPQRPEPLHIDSNAYPGRPLEEDYLDPRWSELADALSEDVGPWPIRRVATAKPRDPISPLGLAATIVAIALAFALAFWAASKLAEGAALAPRETANPTTDSARDLSGSVAGTSGWPFPGAPDTAIAGPLWAGTATFYCATKAEYPPDGSPCTAGYEPGDLVAAIDSDLGIQEGTRVTVRSQAGDGQVTVRIVDVCECPGERLIDLSAAAFQRLAPLAYGVIPVTIELAGPGPTLPPTETGP